ncbi:MAG TPA: universal stress protein [Deltaproteobacteria bacterium]|nr:universal stress protein [Deltaproteobacteria bacterium]
MTAQDKSAGQFKKILFPTDFSSASESALSHALTIAVKFSARLYVLHVIDTSREAAGFYVPHLSYEKLDGEMRAGAKQMLDKFCVSNLRDFEDYEPVILMGAPDVEITNFARNSGVDLIVMATHGMSGIERLIFGSTTERVLRKSGCPVLMVPPSEGGS